MSVGGKSSLMNSLFCRESLSASAYVMSVKWRPSAFFRTDVEVFLGRLGIDTLLLTGTSLSGCVRATAVDAFMRDIRPIIVRECVADRSEAVLDANLFDLEQKYADVVSLTEALDYLAALPQHGRSFGFSAR